MGSKTYNPKSDCSHDFLYFILEKGCCCFESTTVIGQILASAGTKSAVVIGWILCWLLAGMVYNVREGQKFCVVKTGSLSLNMSNKEVQPYTDERSLQMQPIFFPS